MPPMSPRIPTDPIATMSRTASRRSPESVLRRIGSASAYPRSPASWIAAMRAAELASGLQSASVRRFSSDSCAGVARLSSARE